MLARLHQDQKRPREAEAAWTEAARRFPREIGLRLDLSLCRERLGDLAGAESAARDALALEPDNPQTLNFLGYLLADHNLKLEEAVGLIRRALVHDPDNGAYLDSLGWAFYRLGRLDEARAELEQAVSLVGGDPVVREHLGDVYKDLRLMNLAKDQYAKALAADSTNRRLKTKLAEIP
jgi:Flp pilus assembly protein TadD